ncbi:MAG: cyclic nucleotide-binding domain-containing protein [Chitinophagaceae bacterium]
MKRLLDFLNTIHPLSAELMEHLLVVVRYREIEKGNFLLKSGHLCRDIHFIEAGLLRCFYRKGDTEVSSWFMKDGDVIVSVESFFQRKPSYEWIQALEDCKLFYISYEELYNIYKRYPEFNFVSRELIQHYYILWTQLLYAIRMKNAEEKYEWLLERFPDFILRIPAKYLSSWLSISETHFSDVRRGRHK